MGVLMANIYVLLCITLCGLLLYAATGCGDGAPDTYEDRLTLCEMNNQVLRAELCNMGRTEFCE